MKLTYHWLFVLCFISFFAACGENTSNSSQDPNQASSDNSSSTEGNSEELEDQKYKRYALRSGIIEYKMTGLQEGKEILYFDKWGMREAKYTQTTLKIAGVNQKTDKMEIIDGEFIYIVDRINNTGTKGKNPVYEQIIENANSKDLGKLGMKILEDMGGERIGEGEIAGKTCDIWELKSAQTKMWVWKNIPLKIEVDLPGMNYSSEAISLQADVSVPEDKFEIPADIEYQDLIEALEILKGL